MDTASKNNSSFNLATDLLRQCEAMARFALGNGKAVPGNIVETLQTFALQQQSNGTALDIKQLASVHDQLSQIVAPASPATIQLFERASAGGNGKQFLGPVPLIRRMMALAALFLVCIIGISLSPELSGDSADMFEATGWPLFLNEVFLLCAAGLGATFAALFQVNRYIVTCTYDPKYEACYWIKFVLGLIAGFMLSELIDLHADAGASGAGQLTRPILAMVGGFSATVVYRILTRLTETIESLFQGDTKEMVATQQQAIKTRLTQQMNQDRLKLAAGLIELQKLVAAGATDELKQKLDKALADLIPIELGGNGTSDGAAPLVSSPPLSLPADRSSLVPPSPPAVN